MSERCEAIRSKLSAYADGELAPAEEATVREHVAGCIACREALADIALLDEAIASEDVSRSELEWEQLATRVDAAVADAAEADRRAARAHHGWPRQPRGFLRRMFSAPVAFGSASTIVAVLLVILFFGLQKGDRDEIELVLPERYRETAEPAPAADQDREAPDHLRALGYLGGGSSGPTGEASGTEAKRAPGPRAAPTAPAEAAPSVQLGANAVPTEKRLDAPAGRSLRPVEPTLVVSEKDAGKVDVGTAGPAPPTTLEKSVAPREAAKGETPKQQIAFREALGSSGGIVAPTDSAETSAETSGSSDRLASPDSLGSAEASPPAAPPRTLSDFELAYKQRQKVMSPPSTSSRPSAGRPARPHSGKPDAMSQKLEEQKREQDKALGLALAREVYLFARERRDHGDREGAISALLLLLDNEHGRIREQAWHELIELEGEAAMEQGDGDEIARVAATADAFLREYPKSRFRVDMIKRRVALWAAAVESGPEIRCDPALAAEADWQEAVGAHADPAGEQAAARIREHCGS